jgi:exonuclease SbcC
MRILAVRLRNLNSLAGSWAIDFTAPEYAASGIFAITGPTGAGKSTILDALCLALFARTPRLGHISKGSNEIMSRRAGDCFAEVEFETHRGRYRCHWAQHRARRSPEGELQPPRHEIVDARSGKVLETRSKEVARLVEQVTGMEYDRFTRSILLAQGDFAAFLDADADQRAPILEQITGTEIYSRISIAVHERTSAERRTTALLQEAMGSIVLLSEDEEQGVETGIRERTVAAAAVQHRIDELTQGLHRLATIDAISAQLAEIDRLLLDLARRRDEAHEPLRQLERGVRAQSLLDLYTRLIHVQERTATLRTQSERLQTSMEESRGQQRQVGEEHALASQQMQEMIVLRQHEEEVIKTVRTLDLRLHEQKKAVAQLMASRQQTNEERARLAEQRQALEQQLADATAQQQHLGTYFRDHGGDGLLVEQLAGFRGLLDQLARSEQALAQRAQQSRKLRESCSAAEQQLIRLGRDEAQATEALAQLRQRLQQLDHEMTGLLAGQSPAEWRQQAEAAAERLRLLDSLAELLAQQQRSTEEEAILEERLQERRRRSEQQVHAFAAVEERRQLQQQLVAQCEANLQLTLRIRSYEQERARLVDGTPCPLCGAMHHPFADHGVQVEAADGPLAEARATLDTLLDESARRRETLVGLRKDIEHDEQALVKGRQHLRTLDEALTPLLPLLGEAEDRWTQTARLQAQGREHIDALRARLRAIEAMESARPPLSAQIDQSTLRCTDLRHQLQAAQHGLATIERDLQQLAQQRAEEQAAIEACRRTLLQQLQPLGVSDCPPGQSQNLLRHLETRLQHWKEQQSRSDQLAHQRSILQAERDKLDLLLATLDARRAEQEGQLHGLRRDEADLWAERLELYGERDPNVEEQRLKTLVQQAETREQAIRARLVEIDRERHGQSEQLRLTGEELATLLPQSREQEAELLAQLPEAGFVDLDDFRAALLPAEQLAQLTTLHQELDREQTVLIARQAEQRATLAREEELRGEQDREALEAARLAAQQELETLQQTIGADRERLAVNSRHKERFAAQQQELAAQQQELERWELLHLLIGSADGKKFRVFAQGLTFEVMISHANRQLRKMSDRYLLLRDPREPLALQVIDNYQAGEIRSTRNLSGGESFLVSLALALGLSAMASHHVQVDSLFLDEGFGTLDEEALDIALQTLAELRQDGKLIGIISHVPLLRERIDVRIQVQPGPGGNSRLLGPGCAHLV